MRPTHMKVDGEMNQKYLTANCAEYTHHTHHTHTHIHVTNMKQDINSNI